MSLMVMLIHFSLSAIIYFTINIDSVNYVDKNRRNLEEIEHLKSLSSFYSRCIHNTSTSTNVAKSRVKRLSFGKKFLAKMKAKKDKILRQRKKLKKLKKLRRKKKKKFEQDYTYRFPAGVDVFKEKLRVVAGYLATHKYFEIDQRYEGRSDGKGGKLKLKPTYFKHFPVPRLKKHHVTASKECQKGLYQCVSHVFNMAAKSKTIRIQNDIRTLPKKHRPKFKKKSSKYKYLLFKNPLRQFQFRTTASYYMCWYTMHRYSPLTHLGSPCLRFNHNYESVGHVKPVIGLADDKTPYACALLSFCPDPCCVKMPKKGSHLTPGACWRHSSNPCRGVGDSVCRVDMDNNRNFRDLVRNRINYTCPCEQWKRGFEWSVVFKFCVDRDECEIDNYTCAKNEMCRNTVGSYKCRCRRGYGKSRADAECVRQVPLTQISKSGDTIPLKVGQVTGETKVLGFLNKMLGYLGVSSSSHATTTVTVSYIMPFFVETLFVLR